MDSCDLDAIWQSLSGPQRYAMQSPRGLRCSHLSTLRELQTLGLVVGYRYSKRGEALRSAATGRPENEGREQGHG